METREIFSPESRWNYEQFKEYLMALAEGQQFLLPLNQYPSEFELSKDWHNVLNTMRNGTNRDRVERVALVGFNRIRRMLYLSDGTAHGWEKDAPVGELALFLLKVKAGLQDIQGFVGILHSHPPRDLRLLGLTLLREGGLSQGDLYNALVSSYGPFIGVADGGRNVFAFKTRDSIEPKESFAAFHNKPHLKSNILNNDTAIAQQYKLALYVGVPNGNLRRVSPKI